MPPRSVFPAAARQVDERSAVSCNRRRNLNAGRLTPDHPGCSVGTARIVLEIGLKGTLPSTSIAAGDVAPPYGKDKHDFIAAFSNVGPEIDVTGPGVDVISTVPGGYATMSGTSMACPAVTGFAARILERQQAILAATRDQARSDAMAAALFQSAVSLGFMLKYEGHGLPR